MNELRPFQEDGVNFLSRRKAALLADDMGLGKTIQAIVACEVTLARHALVVCPASVKLNWLDEFHKWAPTYNPVVINGSKAQIPELKFGDVIIINYDLIIRAAIYRQLIRLKFDVGIFDEAQRLKGRKTQRTKAVLLKGGLASRCKHKWYLTGTPIENRPVEMYPILRANAPDVIRPYTTYTAFTKHFCGGYFDGYVMYDKGATNTDELNKRLTTGGFMMRRLKKDVLKELPEKTYTIQKMLVTDGGIAAKVQREFEWHQSEAKHQKVGTTDGAEMALLRHELAQYKVPACLERIDEVLDQKNKLVVFAYHRDVIQKLVNATGKYQSAMITGATPSKKRHEEVKRFQEDPDCRLFIGQITAAGVGITLTAADVCAFVEISWVPGEIFQAIDRIHRIGQKNPVQAIFWVLEASLEEHILRVVIDKKNTIEEIVEDRELNEIDSLLS